MKYAFAAAAVLFVPGAAVAGNPYVGIDLGTLSGRSNDIDEYIDYSAAQSPATPLAPAPPAGAESDDTFATRYSRGYDVGLIGGYDFGLIRIEAELSRRSVGLKGVAADDVTDEFLGGLNSNLNRPSESPDPGAPGLAPLTIGDFDLDGSVRAHSAMIVGLIDIDLFKGLSAFGGVGLGRSWVSALGDSDSARSIQYGGGVRYAINDRYSIGLKYRYFNSGIVTLRGDPVALAGNPNRLTVAPSGAQVDQTVNAQVIPELEGRFRTRSWVASLTYNFR
jgi:opacity protein-like surface antigen